MGPEDKIGKVFLVPVDENGELVEVKPTETVWFDWGVQTSLKEDGGVDSGPDGGLHGGPEGGLQGALGRDGCSWSVEFTLAEGEVSKSLMAVLLGITEDEYQDWREWLGERAWLERVTDGVWGLV